MQHKSNYLGKQGNNRQYCHSEHDHREGGSVMSGVVTCNGFILSKASFCAGKKGIIWSKLPLSENVRNKAYPNDVRLQYTS